MRRNYFKGIQHASSRIVTKGEVYTGYNEQLMPADRVPTLTEIVEMFTSGRPIDASLERHLDFNDLERNPVLQKGFDLVDFDKLAKANKATLEQVEQELSDAKLARKQHSDVLAAGSAEAPSEIKTE